MKKTTMPTLFCLSFVAVVVTYGYAQEAGERMTQEQFAVELVKTMRLDGRLPTAALPGDCVNLLESFGVEPLKGWDNKAYLIQEDYLVIMAKVHGKEKLAHERAVAVEEKNIQTINQKWQESYDATKRWIPLDELLNDRKYFPDGPPQSPYGLKYGDKNNDHKVDAHFLPALHLIQFREKFSR